MKTYVYSYKLLYKHGSYLIVITCSFFQCVSNPFDSINPLKDVTKTFLA